MAPAYRARNCGPERPHGCPTAAPRISCEPLAGTATTAIMRPAWAVHHPATGPGQRQAGFSGPTTAAGRGGGPPAAADVFVTPPPVEHIPRIWQRAELSAAAGRPLSERFVNE